MVVTVIRAAFVAGDLLRQGACASGTDPALAPRGTGCGVLLLAPATPARVTISLCGSMVHSDAFDTKLYVLGDLLSAQERPLRPLACNDDFCGYQSQITVRAHACSGSAWFWPWHCLQH